MMTHESEDILTCIRSYIFPDSINNVLEPTLTPRWYINDLTINKMYLIIYGWYSAHVISIPTHTHTHTHLVNTLKFVINCHIFILYICYERFSSMFLLIQSSILYDNQPVQPIYVDSELSQRHSFLFFCL